MKLAYLRFDTNISTATFTELHHIARSAHENGKLNSPKRVGATKKIVCINIQ
jgi:hypothetical protein